MFNNVAISYDQTFTYSNVGKALRNRVYQYLDKLFFANSSLDVLEINCGTGEDAVYFAGKGCRVVATDISPAMIKVAEKKIDAAGFSKEVECYTCDFRELKELLPEQKFDIVFSNFGGLNCISRDELKKLLEDISQKMNSGGRLIAVVMPKFCLWESLYFTAKFEPKKIFRRNTNKVMDVPVGNTLVETWYHPPSVFTQAVDNDIKKISLKPVGIALPPSYLEPFFNRRPRFLNTLDRLEHSLGNIPFLSYISDHFLIDLEKI